MAVTINGTTGIETNTDTGKVKVGASDDIQIYHESGSSYITNLTGNTFVKTLGGQFHVRPSGDEEGLIVKPNGAVELYHDNSKKFETTSYGFVSTGYASIGNGTWSVVAGDDSKSAWGDDQDLQIYHDGSNSKIINSTANLTINAAATEAGIDIKPNGSVDLYYDNSKKLETKSAGVGVTGQFDITHASNSAYGLIVNNTDGDGSLCLFQSNGSTKGSIGISGNNTTYYTTSDYRLKENQVAISDGITRLKTLKPYKFNFKGQSEAVDGFFAHEVSPAVPEAILGTKDETFTKDHDTINVKAGDPKYQQIDQSKLIPLLTAALQEAITKIETLETEVNTLKTKVAALEAS